MIALLVRFSLAAELASYLVVGWMLHHYAGWPVAAVVGAAFASSLGVRLALVCFTCTTGGWFQRTPRVAEHYLGAAQTFRYVLGEYRALLEDNYVNLPWERLVLRRDPVPAPGPATPIILVHGYFSNRGFFRHVARVLDGGGFGPVHAPNFSVILQDIEHFADELHEAIERIALASHAQQVILVCHSMGGLAARRYVRDHGERRIARLVTIATPHQGTAMATLGLGANARQMQRGSAFLRALADSEAARRPGFPATSIYSPHDNLVAPQDTSRLPWARNVALPGLGHVAILHSPALFAVLVDALR